MRWVIPAAMAAAFAALMGVASATKAEPPVGETRLHYVGVDQDGKHVVDSPYTNVFKVDDYGFTFGGRHFVRNAKVKYTIFNLQNERGYFNWDTRQNMSYAPKTRAKAEEYRRASSDFRDARIVEMTWEE